VKLAEELKLDDKIELQNTDMVTLGSAFWCRTAALKKLFSRNWRYEDFPDEPMADDGTISHAIERIFGFVAADAGYQVGTVMCTEYASNMMDLLQGKMEQTYGWLWENIGVKNTHQLGLFDEEKKIIDQLFSDGSRVYLYGVGHYGEFYLKRLLIWGYKPYAFVVSDGMKHQDMHCGYKVYELHEIDKSEKYALIICTNPELQEQIARDLEDKQYLNYFRTVVV
jgi:rhamnosyltransferase